MKVDILRARQAALAEELRESDAASEALALQAALGEEPAKRGFTRLAARRNAVTAQLAALQTAILAAEVEEQAAARAAESAHRAEAIRDLSDLLEERLDVVRAVEADLKTLLRKFGAYAALGHEIESRHMGLTGARPLERQLSPEAIGGRLAEFMAGIGFDTWLPLSRPEVRPVIQSLPAAEAAAQECYRLADRRGADDANEVPA